MNRRGFLLAGGSAVALSGCGFEPLSDWEKATYNRRCVSPDPDAGPLHVDIHCHLLTLKDVDGDAFLVRRVLSEDEHGVGDGDDPKASVANKIARRVLSITRPHIPTIKTETDALVARMRDWAETGRPTDSLAAVCASAVQRHRKVGLVDTAGMSGFISHRLMNASRLAAENPQVKLFTPSMIDFFEGRPTRQTDEDFLFYAALNLATEGRFVPLVSFNPERQYEHFFNPDTGQPRQGADAADSPLSRVERAITCWGFIGVKLHPSSGFSPIDNETHGCLNSPGQSSDSDLSEGFQQRTQARFQYYDQAMQDLFLLCMRLDVPVLVHGSTGIMANERCMTGQRRNPNDFRYPPEDPDLGRGWHRKAAPLDWTNSPKTWIETLNRMNRLAQTRLADARRTAAAERTPEQTADLGLASAPGGATARSLRVCLSHFADGFDGSSLRASEWLTYVAGHIASAPGLYLDVSELSNLFSARRMTATARGHLNAFLGRTSIAAKTMYGSDWHMPGTSRQGTHYYDEFLAAARRSGFPTRIMGYNAVRFFRLNEGGMNRARLERFYTTLQTDLFGEPGDAQEAAILARTVVDLDRVPWWAAARGVTQV